MDLLQMYSRGLDKIITGIIDYQKVFPAEELPRVIASAESMMESFSADNLAWMLAIAVDRIAVPREE